MRNCPPALPFRLRLFSALFPPRFPGIFIVLLRARLPVFLLALASVFSLILVSACAGNPAAPIEDRSRPGMARGAQSYTVRRGDTLFSIAFRYGLDYRRLAAANAIARPYTIFPGQRLMLREAPARSAAGSLASRGSPTVSTAPKVSPAAAKGTAAKGTTAKATAAKGTAVKARPAPPPAKTAPAPGKAAPAPGKTAPASAAAVSAKAASGAAPAASASWQWPAAGRVVRRFDGTLNKGIDIAGPRGDVVRATRAGRVVYAGTGIAGYGLMLILRHSEEYLSAYGHSDALLVKEGDAVRAGQGVARRGSSGTDSVKLHFEIRRHGRPLDPLSVLPKR